MRMAAPISATVTALALCLLLPAARADIYGYIDEQGAAHVQPIARIEFFRSEMRGALFVDIAVDVRVRRRQQQAERKRRDGSRDRRRHAHQMSASASLPCSSSHVRRAAASPLPISMLKRASDASKSYLPFITGNSRRVSGFIVVSHYCSAFISPSPLKREMLQPPSFSPSLRSLSSIASSSPSSNA